MTTKSRYAKLWQIDLRRVTFVLLWIFIFCVPWEEEIVIPVDLALSHVVGLVAAALGLLACLNRGKMRRPASLHYLAAALVAWAGVSYGWSIAPELTRIRVASYVQLLFMVWLIWEFADSTGRQRSLFAAYVLGTWVAAASTLYSFATGTGTNLGLSDGRYTAAGSNENELGIVLALGICMASHLLSIAKRSQILWLVSIPTFMVAILLTGSRGSFLASMIALLLVPFSLRRFSTVSKVAGATALIALLLTGIAALPPATWQRVESIPSELASGTLTKRTDIWSAGLDAYREHPVAGVGAGAFEASVFRQLDIAYVAHNSYLSVLVELGAIGMVLFTVFLAALWSAAFSLPRPWRTTWIFLLLTWGIAVSSVTWEHRKPTWFLFGLLIAQSAALTPARRRVRELDIARPVRELCMHPGVAH